MEKEVDLTQEASRVSADVQDHIEKGRVSVADLESHLKYQTEPYGNHFRTENTSTGVDGYTSYESIAGVVTTLRGPKKSNIPALHPGDLCIITGPATVKFRDGMGVRVIEIRRNPWDPSHAGRIIKVARGMPNPDGSGAIISVNEWVMPSSIRHGETDK